MMDNINKQKGEIQDMINQEEEEKRQIEEQMKALAERLEVIDSSLSKKYITRNEYDKTIQETQSAFNKILESSQTLLHVLKKEGAQLYKKKVQTVGEGNTK
tara:strand:- start:94 stop:396 length:303 start_codon:yes stop_codon:yes gene_type:complete